MFGLFVQYWHWSLSYPYALLEMTVFRPSSAGRWGSGAMLVLWVSLPSHLCYCLYCSMLMAYNTICCYCYYVVGLFFGLLCPSLIHVGWDKLLWVWELLDPSSYASHFGAAGPHTTRCILVEGDAWALPTATQLCKLAYTIRRFDQLLTPEGCRNWPTMYRDVSL